MLHGCKLLNYYQVMMTWRQFLLQEEKRCVIHFLEMCRVFHNVLNANLWCKSKSQTKSICLWSICSIMEKVYAVLSPIGLGITTKFLNKIHFDSPNPTFIQSLLQFDSELISLTIHIVLGN